MTMIPNGGKAIQTMIDEAVLMGSRKAEVRGSYEIERTIVIPSGFTLVLDNCTLRMADNTFCNMFTNAARFREAPRLASEADRGIVIEGRGRVVLDGGSYNGLCESNSEKDGRPHISQNNILLFANVEGFRISGLQIRSQRWWAMNFLYCRRGVIRDIDFCSDCTMTDRDGNRTAGLSYAALEAGSDIYLKNSDGIDLRLGCRDIDIENITGFTEDDTIALTALRGRLEELFRVEDLPDEIANVTIRNVHASAFCALVRLLNQGGTKLYNVLIDGVMDASADSPCLDRGAYAVRIGDRRAYGGRTSTKHETYNIVVRNVFSRAKTALDVVGDIGQLSSENILTFDAES